MTSEYHPIYLVKIFVGTLLILSSDIIIFYLNIYGHTFFSIQAITWYVCIIAAGFGLLLLYDDFREITITETQIIISPLIGKKKVVNFDTIKALKTFYLKTSGMANKTGIEKIEGNQTLAILVSDNQINISESVYSNYKEIKAILYSSIDKQ